MFIKKNLLKSVNENYYRNYQDTQMKPLLFDFDVNTAIHNYEILRKKVGICDQTVLELEDIISLSKNVNSLVSKQACLLKEQKENLEDKIKSELPTSQTFKEVTNILVSNSCNACLVGGFIRDSILGYESKDIDFATDTPYKKLTILFENNGFTIKEQGEEFLVMIVSKNNEMYEIANFRKDSASTDARHPDYVEIGTIEEDSLRRDFTVNSLFFRLLDNSLLDLTGLGIEDILNKKLRFVGNPKDRLKEDALRLWRAFRLSKTKNLKLERKTEKALRENFNWCYERSNPARVLQEMIKI